MGYYLLKLALETWPANILLAQCSPSGTMLNIPIDQGFFKANIMPSLLAFDPFVAKNFSTLC